MSKRMRIAHKIVKSAVSGSQRDVERADQKIDDAHAKVVKAEQRKEERRKEKDAHQADLETLQAALAVFES